MQPCRFCALHLPGEVSVPGCSQELFFPQIVETAASSATAGNASPTRRSAMARTTVEMGVMKAAVTEVRMGLQGTSLEMQPLVDVLMAGHPGEHSCICWQCPGEGTSGEGPLNITIFPELALILLSLACLQQVQQSPARNTRTSAAADSASPNRTQSVMASRTARTILMRTTAVSTHAKGGHGFLGWTPQINTEVGWREPHGISTQPFRSGNS